MPNNPKLSIKAIILLLELIGSTPPPEKTEPEESKQYIITHTYRSTIIGDEVTRIKGYSTDYKQAVDLAYDLIDQGILIENISILLNSSKLVDRDFWRR